MKKGVYHKDKYTFSGMLSDEALWTFEFFSKSLADTLSDYLDVMEENHLCIPADDADELFDMLEDISADLRDDYHADCLQLGRFRKNILAFYDLAFSLCSDLEDDLSDAPLEAVYYSQVFVQGLKHFLPVMLQSLLMDLPESQKLQQFIEQIQRDFSGLAPLDIHGSRLN
ncbi:hypothetical protein [Megasphaera stantonii]|uniref:Uncharacterized protein n=1 Tax=Megasphaera stantonii TaxID=2144175 RepID=A0A346B0Y8_9FIRM|nr:hypothetical protein [Megasphaera stantonii]AXL21781.1 hypothetical protein DKB62_09520 [Megasphaera stantonii]